MDSEINTMTQNIQQDKHAAYSISEMVAELYMLYIVLLSQP